MPRISTIEPQKKKENRFNVYFNVYVDGQFAFAASPETIFRHHLKSDQEITQDGIDALVKENEYGLLLDRVLRWLAVRPRSAKELTDYLQRPNPKAANPRSERAIQLVIDKVTELGYVDDDAFATWYVESRIRSKPKGKRLLQLELRQKGIDPELAAEVIDRTMAKPQDAQVVTEEDLAFKVAEKKYHSYQHLETRELYQKMGAYLSRRGFDWDTTKAVIDRLPKKG